jgi:putative ABC transport system permease protein
MNAWFVIALRNIWKNRRRSAYTIIAIALGYAGVNLFGGFKHYLFSTMRNAFIHVNAMGHVTVYKKGYNEEGRRDPTRFLITAAELAKIRQTLARVPDVVIVAPQLAIQGLASNGRVSQVFVALSSVPSDVENIRKRVGGWMSDDNRTYYTGGKLTDEKPHALALSRGLASVLSLEIGGDLVTMAPTVAGHINALDAQYIARYDATIDVLDDKEMEVPLAFAQSLYDTDSVDRAVVLFDEEGDLAARKATVEAALAGAGLDMEVLTWIERTPFFVGVERMNNLIFLFMFLIVFVIVVMSVINTMGMAILERTREIGTLRALGLKRRGIIRLFALESAIIGVLGSTVGFLLFCIAWGAVAWLDPQWIPPTYKQPIPLQVDFVGIYLLGSLVFLSVLSLGAAVFPAQRAAHMEVVDALGHV